MSFLDLLFGPAPSRLPVPEERLALAALLVRIARADGFASAPELAPALVAKVSKQPDLIAAAGYQGILELRTRHRELDHAVLAAYGWGDLALGHDFHAIDTLPENDRIRYTISPSARKELLRRLLALDDARNGVLSVRDSGRSGFLK